MMDKCVSSSASRCSDADEPMFRLPCLGISASGVLKPVEHVLVSQGGVARLK
jgi:hypothetical protein